MRPRTVRRIYSGAIVVVMLILVAGIVAALAAMPRAHAEPDVHDLVHDAALFCRWLDGDSSPAGVLRAVNEFKVQRVGEEYAIATVQYALDTVCPEYQQAFVDAADVYVPKTFIA